MKFVAGLFLHYWQTTVHKVWVAYYLLKWWQADRRPLWIWKAIKHDLSKYGWTESKHFARTIWDLKHTEYGTDEYRALLAQIKPALDHHYAVNDHHPEYYGPKGVYAMKVTEQIEMICDWAAAIRRTKDGSMEKSLPINMNRFDYDSHLDGTFRYIATEIGALAST